MESYEQTREIGKGSYGVVWLVKNKKDKKNYVLKKIDLRKTSERDKQSAQQEAQLLKTLKHPNIVSYKESFQIDGYLHIVMLYCDGGDLYTKIKEQNGKYLEETQVVEWFVQIAMALQYMHDKNILHRDLKTQNIFLTKNKIIKVGDLGIARVLKSNNDMATTIIGTPYYMSPELFTNKPYNSKSDVWALGCCVYEMTTLKHAFNAKDMSSLVFKITRGKMPSIPMHYSKEFVALIESMLNLDPKKRPTVNKILRDSFIRKNIMLFLERTKQKQQQLEKDNELLTNKRNTEITSNYKKQEVNYEPKIKNQIVSPEPVSPPEVKSEFVNLNKYNSEKPLTPSQAQSPSPAPSAISRSYHRLSNNNSDPISSNKQQYSSNSQFSIDSSNYRERSASDKQIQQKSGPRVRISSVVENIETREHFSISPVMNDYDENDQSDEERSPYQLTRPMKGSFSSPDIHSMDDKSSSKNSNNYKYEPEIQNEPYRTPPKIMERKPKVSDTPPKIQSSSSSLSNSRNSEYQSYRPTSNSSSSENNKSDNDNLSNSDKNLIKANLDARERRRQRLRLSQNDSDSKPPILRKNIIKSHQSEVFYNSNSNKSSIQYDSSSKQVSKSYERNSDPKDYLLQDSLKIFRNGPKPNQINSNQASSNYSVGSGGSYGDIKTPAQVTGNSFTEKRPNISNHSSPSSSSSSISSSDNDPGSEIIREEKRRLKDKKEIDNFIDKLDSTLRAATLYKNDSEVEDIKDEILEDLEEEAIQAEMISSQNSIKSRGVYKNERRTGFNGVRNSNDFDENDENDYVPEENEIKYKRPISKNYSYEQDASIKPEKQANSIAQFAGATLGATNHMQQRMNILEKEILQIMTRSKLDEAFKILESFHNEEEIKNRLNKLLGRNVQEANYGKIWLLKFCKETSSFGSR